MTITSIDPATGDPIEEYDEHSPEEAAAIVEEADEAFRRWRSLGFDDRAEVLLATADLLEDEAEDLGEIMAREMGKPLAQGISEAEKCAWVCRYYAENAEEQLAPGEVETDASRSFVTFRPLGVVLAIMPWNFPLWQVFRAGAPALMAGNAMVVKHAANVPGCALAIEDLFRRGGLPHGLLRAVMVSRDRTPEVVESLLEHDLVRAATLTGSVRAGKAVAAKAGSLLKKTVLELGGSDPYLVLSDADVEAAAATCVTSRLINSGQSCIAAKRLVVVDRHHDRFLEAVTEGMAEARLGNPLDEGVDVGPLARGDLREELHRQVEESVQKGARAVIGGELPDGPGFFYPPTVLADVGPGMPAWEEELFGPVAVVIRARDDGNALRIANDSRFGLGAAVFTGDAVRGERIAAEELEAGCCFVNDFVRSDPRLPFGGIKESGYGRELSPWGIREFVNVKTVWVA